MHVNTPSWAPEAPQSSPRRERGHDCPSQQGGPERAAGRSHDPSRWHFAPHDKGPTDSPKRGAPPPGGESLSRASEAPSYLIHVHKAGSPESTSSYDSPESALPERLARFGPAKKRALLMGDYLGELAGLGDLLPAELGSRIDVEKRADKLARCGCWLKFRDYFTVGQTRLVDGRFCCQPLLCPLCAIRRGSKLLRAYVEKLATVLHEASSCGVWLVSLTVKNGPDLGERFQHLRGSLLRLMERRRLYLNRKSGRWTEAARAHAGVGFLEFKRGTGSSQWHPHYHGAWVCSSGFPPDAQALSAEWHELTGDSFIIDVRPFESMRRLDLAPVTSWAQLLAGDFVELAKYALKFSELTTADNWQAFRVLGGRRLVDAFGWLRGVELDPSMTDEDVTEGDLPYYEILAGYVAGVYQEQQRRLTSAAVEFPARELSPEEEAAVQAAEASFFR